MEPKVLSSFDEAVGDIPDGASILLGGFGPGTAHNLIAALDRHGARALTLIATPAAPRGPPRRRRRQPRLLHADRRGGGGPRGQGAPRLQRPHLPPGAGDNGR